MNGSIQTHLVIFKLRYKRTEREFLTEPELKQLSVAQFNDGLLDKVQKMFIFSCFTGLSFIDLVSLQPHQVVKNKDGIQWISTTRTKTLTVVNIPLLKPAVEILETFAGNTLAKVHGTVFPIITNHEMNRGLKIIAGLCSRQKTLTFHMTRHTFATTVTLMNGVPIESISKMLGHTKLSTTMIYARVSQTKIGMDMQLLQNRPDER